MSSSARQPAEGVDPLLVLVSRCPGSGKTTLARGLAEDLRMPLLGKDVINSRSPSLAVDTTDGYRPDYPTVVAFVEGAR